MKTKTSPILPLGYVPCACRDCLETAIGEPGALCGEPGALCGECEDAGCELERECLAAADADFEQALAEQIADDCRSASRRHLVMPESAPPRDLWTRLVGDLAELQPGAVVPSVPAAALADGSHAYWDSEAGTAAWCAVVQALNAFAPAGFCLLLQDGWLGFFPLCGEPDAENVTPRADAATQKARLDRGD